MSKKYNFDKTVDREGSCCIKYDNRIGEFGTNDVIPMWIADMDFEAPDFIYDAIIRRANHRVYGYGIRDCCYYDAIIAWEKRHNGWDVRREWIDFTPGVVAGFVFALRCVTLPGDGVAILPPTYPPFAAQIKANDRRLVESPMKLVNGHFEIDFDDLDRKLEGARALLYCNPHNPTGRVFTPQELTRLGELCVKHNVTIISDEIHSDLIIKPNHHTHIAALNPEFARRTITFVAPTKTFNIAGLSTSVVICPDEKLHACLRRELDRYHVEQGNVFGTATLVAAYNNGDQWLDELLDYIAGNMELVSRFFAERMPQVIAHPSEGTYLMWLDFRGLGLDHDRLWRFLIDNAKVGLNDGRLFGAEGDGFMRINLATSRAIVTEALERIATAWERYDNR